MNNMILDLIQKPNDIKKVNKEDYNELADEIRECIIENVSTNGGHLSSSLGVVELTMALHLTTAHMPEFSGGQADMGCRSSGVCP